jgi:hypothetical protein
MTAEVMLELISNTTMGATKDDAILHSVHIDGHIQNEKDITFTAHNWKRGADILEDYEKSLSGRLEKIII